MDQLRSGSYRVDLAQWFQTQLREPHGIRDIDQIEHFKTEIANYEARILQARAAHAEAISKAVDRGGEVLSDFRLQTIQALEATGPQIDRSLVSIRGHIDELTAHLRRFRRALAWDKVVFGFWIPLVAAIILVAVSSPQAWLDVRPTVISLPDCIQRVERCLYRDDIASAISAPL